MSRLRTLRPGPSRRLFAVLALVAPAALALPLVLASPAGATPEKYCGLTWGSGAETGARHVDAAGADGGVTGVRSGRHACFDRLVIDLAHPGTQWHVAYVDAVRTGGAGDVVATAGGARLQLSVMADEYRVDPATGLTEVIFQPADRTRLRDVTGYDTFRQVTYGGGFEAVHVFGLGVRARLPFRVLHLDGPGEGSRLVVDVAHRWS